MELSFPVEDKFQARQVTELDFVIDPQDERVYVNLDSIRSEENFSEILYNLNVDDDKLVRPTESYVKILFSGHRGCGKTIELHRFQKYIDHPDRYSSVFIDMEKEFDITTFQPEDLFVTLIAKLVEKLDESGIRFDSGQLTEILRDWLGDEEIVKELKDCYSLDISSEVGVGAGFLGFVKLKSSLKALFSSSSTTARIIREKIKKNPHQLIDRFNRAMADARGSFADGGKGSDILFVIDGFEKMPFDIFRQVFIRDSALIRNLETNIIFTIPINSFYDISSDPSADFFQTSTLPMIPVTEKSAPLLAEIVSKRIERQTFFEGNALEYCVEKSGGCLRQLLRIVNKSLVMRRGDVIDPETAQKACHILGQEMLDRLDSEHRKILNEETYNNADKKSLDLLNSLAVLKYNGTRVVNPLLVEFQPKIYCSK